MNECKLNCSNILICNDSNKNIKLTSNWKYVHDLLLKQY
jgi:hypothetical protein